MKQCTYLALALAALACGAPDEPRGLTQATYRDFPDGGATVELEQVAQAISAYEHMGWLLSLGTDRLGRQCPALSAAGDGYICLLPATTKPKVFVDTAGFSAADAQLVTSTASSLRQDMNLEMIDTQWAWSSAADAAGANVTFRKGTLSASDVAPFASDDMRQYVKFRCTQSSPTITENPARAGIEYRTCPKLEVTVDMDRLRALDSCTSGGCVSNRVRHFVGSGYYLSAGWGLGNINPTLLNRRARVTTQFLSTTPSSRDYCAANAYSTSLSSSVTIDTTVCD